MKDCSSGAPLSYNGVANPLVKEYGNVVTRATVLQRDDTTDGGDLYLSFELGEQRWTLTLSDGRRRPSRHTVAAGDTAAVAECVRKAKARCRLEPTAAVHACYEARVNGVSGLELMHHLAPHLTDPYEGISPFDTKLQRRALRSLLRIGPRRLRTSVESQGRTAEQFQFCPKCLFSGLHGVVHQRRGLQQCPAHAIPMRSRCKHCERPIAYRLTTTLLDAPFACPFCRRRLVARIWLPGHSRRLAMTHRTSLMRAWVTGL